MSKPVNRLGRGLNSLIGTRAPAPAPADAPRQSVAPSPHSANAAVADGSPERMREIPIESIDPNPRQPRREFDEPALSELAASIRQSGVLQPLLVRPHNNRFELVAGERRLRAAKRAGLQTVPAIVRQLTSAESLEIALIENLQREDLSPIERAKAYQEYISTFGGQPEALAAKLGESRTTILNYLRLLRLHAEIIDMIATGKLAMGQARAIAGVADAQRQLAIAKLAVRRNLNARQVEELVQSDSSDAAAPDRKAAPPLDRHLLHVQTELSKAVGLTVTLRQGKAKNAGTILIRYNSLDEFDRLATRLAGRSVLE